VPGKREGLGLVDRNLGAFDLVGEAGIVPPPFRLVAGLAVHLGEQLAVVANLDFSQRLGLALNQIADPAQHLATGRGGHGRPGPVPHGTLGGGHRLVDIGF